MVVHNNKTLQYICIEKYNDIVHFPLSLFKKFVKR